MPEMSPDYAAAIARALLAVRPVPSAVDDITSRLMRDRPGDIVGYLESCRTALPSYFESPEPVTPAAPAPGDTTYNDWFLKNLAKIAGGPTAASGTTAKARPPRQISRGSPAFDK